jgi:hypothetical protein
MSVSQITHFLISPLHLDWEEHFREQYLAFLPLPGDGKYSPQNKHLYDFLLSTPEHFRLQHLILSILHNGT